MTEPDKDVEDLYILACGYNPKVPGEGPGGNEQHVLTYILRQGAPAGPAAAAMTTPAPKSIAPAFKPFRIMPLAPTCPARSPLVLMTLVVAVHTCPAGAHRSMQKEA